MKKRSSCDPCIDPYAGFRKPPSKASVRGRGQESHPPEVFSLEYHGIKSVWSEFIPVLCVPDQHRGAYVCVCVSVCVCMTVRVMEASFFLLFRFNAKYTTS